MTAGVILAGGASTRLGMCKALVLVNQTENAATALAARMAAAGLSPIVLATAAHILPSLAQCPGVDVLVDDAALRPPGASGPLCGLAAALQYLGRAAVFWPVDHPLAAPALLRHLAQRAGPTTLPEQPLHAVAGPAVLEPALALLADAQTSARALWARVGAGVVPSGTLAMLDPTGGWRLGFNTPQQLAAFRQHARDCAMQGGP